MYLFEVHRDWPQPWVCFYFSPTWQNSQAIIVKMLFGDENWSRSCERKTVKEKEKSVICWLIFFSPPLYFPDFLFGSSSNPYPFTELTAQPPTKHWKRTPCSYSDQANSKKSRNSHWVTDHSSACSLGQRCLSSGQEGEEGGWWQMIVDITLTESYRGLMGTTYTHTHIHSTQHCYHEDQFNDQTMIKLKQVILFFLQENKSI